MGRTTGEDGPAASEALPSRRRIWLRKLVYPGHTLPTALGPVLVGTALALQRGVFAAGSAAAALLAGWLVQLGGVIADNYQNLSRHRSDREHPLLVAALRDGVISLSGLRRAAAGCYLMALLPGLYLVGVGGPTVLAVGVAGAAASWVYSGGPWPLKYHGLSEALFFVFFGPVAVAGVHYVQAASASGPTVPLWPPAGSLPLDAVLLGIPVGALITNILVIDDLRDLPFDREKGERTLTAIFGRAAGHRIYLGLTGVAFAAPPLLVAAGRFEPWILLPLLVLPEAVMLGRYVLAHREHEALIPATPRAGRLMLAYSLLLGAGTLL